SSRRRHTRSVREWSSAVCYSDLSPWAAIGRAHLYDPNWTLHAAAAQGYSGPGATWPDQWAAGSRPPQTGRTDGPRPRLALIREASLGTSGTRHARWRPAAAARASAEAARGASNRSTRLSGPPPHMSRV